MLFDSVHDVMRTESMLKARGMWCDLVPTPRELTSECGMAVEIRCCDVDSARSLTGAEAGLSGIYKIIGQETELISG